MKTKGNRYDKIGLRSVISLIYINVERYYEEN